MTRLRSKKSQQLFWISESSSDKDCQGHHILAIVDSVRADQPCCRWLAEDPIPCPDKPCGMWAAADATMTASDPMDDWECFAQEVQKEVTAVDGRQDRFKLRSVRGNAGPLRGEWRHPFVQRRRASLSTPSNKTAVRRVIDAVLRENLQTPTATYSSRDGLWRTDGAGDGNGLVRRIDRAVNGDPQWRRGSCEDGDAGGLRRSESPADGNGLRCRSSREDGDGDGLRRTRTGGNGNGFRRPPAALHHTGDGLRRSDIQAMGSLFRHTGDGLRNTTDGLRHSSPHLLCSGHGRRRSGDCPIGDATDGTNVGAPTSTPRQRVHYTPGNTLHPPLLSSLGPTSSTPN